MATVLILKSVALFVTAGICEIGGGYLVWLWLRKGRGFALGVLGGLVLFFYGVVPTFRPRTLDGSMRLMVACLSCCRFSAFSTGGRIQPWPWAIQCRKSSISSARRGSVLVLPATIME